MHISAYNYLIKWKDSHARKPLIIRGARQVGKTWLAREFGAQFFEEVIEINFEENPDAISLFPLADMTKSLAFIRSATKKSVKPGKCLLILDEIQTAPEMIPRLRYLYEHIPELHVIATGSLIEFALNNAQFSMPVGRVEFLYLPPITFIEYLNYIEQKELVDFLNNYELTDEFPSFIHQKLCGYFIDYTIIGGMPESIDVFHRTHDQLESEKIKEGILQTYESDFEKYRGKVDSQRIRTVFNNSIPTIGNKYVYARVDGNDTAQNLKRALNLLIMAQVYTPVYHTSSSLPPLSQGVKHTIFKLLFLDVGLVATKMKLSLSDAHLHFKKVQKLNTSFLGAQAEQFIGQHLLSSRPLYEKPELYYWTREKRGASAEIDYLQYQKGAIYPVEVKSASPGRLRSLQIFLKERKGKIGVRYSLALPQLYKEEYVLLSLPHYLVEQQERLVDKII